MKQYMALFFSLASLTAYGSDYSEDDYSDSEYNGRDSGISAQSAQALAKFEGQFDFDAQWSERQVKRAAQRKRNDLARTQSAAALEEERNQQEEAARSRSTSPKKCLPQSALEQNRTLNSPLPSAAFGKKVSARTLAITARRAADAKQGE